MGKKKSKSRTGVCLDPFESRQRQGEALIRLQRDSREWVKRRIEVVSFIDRLTAQRETTLDLEFSPDLLCEFPTLHGRTLLPIKLLARQPSLNVTVFDAAGTLIPQLNRMAEREFVAAGLTYKYCQAKLEAGEQHRDTQWLFKNILKDINFDDEKPLTSLSEPDEWVRVRDNYMVYRLVIPVVDLRPHIDNYSKGAILRLVVSNLEVLKPLEPVNGNQGDKPAPYVQRLRDYFATVDDWHAKFDVDQVEACHSFHFELIAPAGIRVMDNGTLTIEGQKDPVKLKDTDPYDDRAHFFHVISEDWVHDDVIKRSRVELVLRPMDDGLASGLFWTAALNTAVLCILFFTTGWSATGLPGLNVKFRPDTQSIVTALLLGPTLLATFMIRDTEHVMTKRILIKPRRRVAVSGIATFVASLTFALETPPSISAILLALLTLLTGLMAVTGWKSLLRSRP
ncbi:MAG: hypothetical protein ACRDYA_10970 [Egibacteraceae bacterium]